MTELVKDHRKTINDNWTPSMSYLAAVGISGVFVSSISRHIQTVSSDSVSAAVRRATCQSLSAIVYELANSLEAFAELETLIDYHRKAVAHLREVYSGLDGLNSALFAEVA